MADSVLAAFDSCRFSWVFFFFFAWRAVNGGFKFLGITLAFNGILRSGWACDMRLPNGKLYSESRDGKGRRIDGGGGTFVGICCDVAAVDDAADEEVGTSS